MYYLSKRNFKSTGKTIFLKLQSWSTLVKGTNQVLLLLYAHASPSASHPVGADKACCTVIQGA